MKSNLFASIVGHVIAASRDGCPSTGEFKSRFDAEFPGVHPMLRYSAAILFRLTRACGRLAELLRLKQLLSYGKTRPSDEDQEPAKPSPVNPLKKPLIMSQVDKHISIEDVLHSDIQLAISSKPLHVKYYTYQADYDSFLTYVEADLKALKNQKG